MWTRFGSQKVAPLKTGLPVDFSSLVSPMHRIPYHRWLQWSKRTPEQIKRTHTHIRSRSRTHADALGLKSNQFLSLLFYSLRGTVYRRGLILPFLWLIVFHRRRGVFLSLALFSVRVQFSRCSIYSCLFLLFFFWSFPS